MGSIQDETEKQSINTNDFGIVGTNNMISEKGPNGTTGPWYCCTMYNTKDKVYLTRKLNYDPMCKVNVTRIT